jgi:hypothetical protein
MSNEGMGLAPVIGIVVAVLAVMGAIGLTIYGGSVQPASRHYEQVVPDDRLPH